MLTIPGERLELARLVRVSPASRGVFAVIVAAFVAALALTIVNLGLGVRLAGAAMAGLGGWLGWQDIARHTVKQPALPRFTAPPARSAHQNEASGGLPFGGPILCLLSSGRSRVRLNRARP